MEIFEIQVTHWLLVLSIVTGFISAPIMERNKTRTWCEYIDRMKHRWRLVMPFLFMFFLSAMVAIMIYEYYNTPFSI